MPSEFPGEGALEEKRKAGIVRSPNSHLEEPIMATLFPTSNPTVPGEEGSNNLLAGWLRKTELYVVGFFVVLFSF